MSRFVSRTSRLMVAGVGAGVALVTTLTPAANATQGQSQLLVSKDDSTVANGTMSTSLTIDGSVSLTATVWTKLDGSCPNVFVDPSGHGQTYSIVTTFNPTGIATVSPTNPTGLACTTVTAFTITGVSDGTTTLSLAPMATNHGLQKKLSDVPATVTVTVINSGSTGGQTCEDTNTCPADNPAAPAVANGIFNLPDPIAIAACKAQFPGKNWRGSAISGVAAIMPTPESVKNNYSFSDWEQQVYNMLAVVCNYPPETVT